uniref:Uncharacterized protein n=1 Tax=Rhizophora mucronata TaxID=61149 RepID=A0A2P2N3P5_RHIMU
MKVRIMILCSEAPRICSVDSMKRKRATSLNLITRVQNMFLLG